MENYEVNLHSTTDARVWASEFMRIIVKSESPVIIDEGLMLGWFANAMMAGYDQAKREEPETVAVAGNTANYDRLVEGFHLINEANEANKAAAVPFPSEGEK